MHYKSTADKIHELQAASLVDRIELAVKLGADFEIVRKDEVNVERMREIEWYSKNTTRLSAFMPESRLVCSGPWAPARKRKSRVQKKIDARHGAAKYGDAVSRVWDPIPPVSIKRRRAPLIQMAIPYDDREAWYGAELVRHHDNDGSRGWVAVWAVDIKRVEGMDD